MLDFLRLTVSTNYTLKFLSVGTNNLVLDANWENMLLPSMFHYFVFLVISLYIFIFFVV